MNQFQCFVLTIMSSKDMIMIILENMCIEITSRWYIYSVVKEKKTIWIYRPLAICEDIFCKIWVTKESLKNVLVQGIQINYYSCTERREEEDSNLYRGHKLLLSKNWFEVVRVDCGIASIPLFRIDIPQSSESIQFDTKMTRIEPNSKIELREILRPLCLSLCQYLGNGKILKIFMFL